MVVIAGAGKAFCAGHDLKEMGADLRDAPVRALFERCSAVMTALTRLPQPVIARVHGIATAAGCQLVAACDLAVAADDSRFATSGVKYGLFCSTPMVALSRNVARKPAMEMLLTGDFVDAAEACAWVWSTAWHPPTGSTPPSLPCAPGCSTSRATSWPLGKRAFYRQLELGLTDAYALHHRRHRRQRARQPTSPRASTPSSTSGNRSGRSRDARLSCAACRRSSTVEHPPCKREVGGSSPFAGTTSRSPSEPPPSVGADRME